MLFKYTLTGQMEKVIDDRGETVYRYDERDRLISRKDPTGVYLDSGATIEYDYDEAGNPTLVRTPGGETVFDYNERNRLETVSDSVQGVTSYFYDDGNNLKRTVFGNGVVESRSYDKLNRLEFLENKLGDTVISSYDYSLDLVGNRRAVLEDTGRLVEYDYDALYRLTEERISNDPLGDNRTIGYRYDHVGNREIKEDSVEGVTSYVYDDNDLLRTETLVKDNVTVYSRVDDYDDNGNTVSRVENGTEETIYRWDFENRLVGVETPNGDVISYEYDSDGVRVSAAVNGEKTEFLVDKNRDYAQVLEESVDGEATVRYVHGLDLISREGEGQTFVYLVDGLGSTRVLTDEIGGVINTYTYEAFGELLRSTGTVENKYRFAGEQFDEDLQQYYLRARYYDPSLGRFTRRDSYEGDVYQPLTLHKYLYTNANPVNGIDPSGLYRLELRYRGPHADILIRDKNGTRVYWAGPENHEHLSTDTTGIANNTFYNFSDSSGIGSVGFGNIASRYANGGITHCSITGPKNSGKNEEEEKAFLQLPGRDRQIVADSGDPNDTFPCDWEFQIKLVLDTIQFSEIPYRWLTVNSNSAAFQALEQTLGSRPTPQGINRFIVRAWDVNPFTAETGFSPSSLATRVAAVDVSARAILSIVKAIHAQITAIALLTRGV